MCGFPGAQVPPKCTVQCVWVQVALWILGSGDTTGWGQSLGESLLKMGAVAIARYGISLIPLGSFRLVLDLEEST